MIRLHWGDEAFNLPTYRYRACQTWSQHPWQAQHEGYFRTTWEGQPALLEVQRCTDCLIYRVKRLHHERLEHLHPPHILFSLPPDTAALLRPSWRVRLRRVWYRLKRLT